MANSDETKAVQVRLKSLQMIVLAMGTAMPVLGVIALFTLPEAPFDLTHLLICAAVGAAGGLLSSLLTSTFIKPLDRDDPAPAHNGVTRLFTGTFPQIALAEGAGLVLFALAFVFELSPFAVLVGMAISGVAVFAVGWPGRGRLQRARRVLEAKGARCPIDELAERRV